MNAFLEPRPSRMLELMEASESLLVTYLYLMSWNDLLIDKDSDGAVEERSPAKFTVGFSNLGSVN